MLRSSLISHLSVRPKKGNSPTQGERKTVTRVGLNLTTFGSCSPLLQAARPEREQAVRSFYYQCYIDNVQYLILDFILRPGLSVTLDALALLNMPCSYACFYAPSGVGGIRCEEISIVY